MTEIHKNTVDAVIDAAAKAAGVPAYPSPQRSAGEKLVYRVTPGRSDGEWEEFTVTMRFISGSMTAAYDRMTKVTRTLCAMGDRDPLGFGITAREGAGGSGIIGRTGHCYVSVKYIIKRRFPYGDTERK